MRKIFNHLFSETIWSMGYWGTPDDAKIWIETRSADKNTWHNLDLKTYQLNQSSQIESNSLQWLTGLKDGGVFLKLRQGKNPGIESLHAYHFPSGTLRYSIDLSQWTALNGEYLECAQGIIDLNSGEFCSGISGNPADWNIESPQHFEESQSEFKPFATLFEKKFGEKIGKGIDYWEGSDKLIFSYYIYDNTWKNKLRICDFEFQTLFIETIAEGDLMGYQTFQRFGNALIFIKEKRELLIYADI
jgi:hypothetical protein